MKTDKNFNSAITILLFYIILIMVIGLLLSCTKEPEPEFILVKPKYAIEGTYEGISILDCPGFGYHKERKNTIEIT